MNTLPAAFQLTRARRHYPTGAVWQAFANLAHMPLQPVVAPVAEIESISSDGTVD